MFNRSTKLTAVLVAAASIVSSVPAMAATRLANKDGNITDAVSFKDGKYLYEGYRTDDDDNGLYYNGGDKDKKLDDVDTIGYAGMTKYGEKKLAVAEGTSDEYILDLSTGKVTDDDTVTDLISNAETKLQGKLKKTDRYGKDLAETAKLSLIGNRFEDTWFEYSVTTNNSTEVKGFTNESGSYIDCSYNANIYAFGSDNKMHKLENVGDTESGITLNSMKHLYTIGQDDKYIYSLIEADISKAYTVTSTPTLIADGTKTYYVQKVSKAQGDKEKDAYLPKTTETFQLAADTSIVDNGDSNKAYNELMKAEKGEDNAVSYVVDGAVYVTRDDGEKVHTWKIALKNSEKLDYTTNKDKIGVRLAKKDDDKDHDAKDWSIDVKGNVWAIDEGKILKSSKAGDFETVYTCDRSLDKLDVYDENNLIAWDASGDVYTTVQEGSDEAKKEAGELIGEQPAQPAAKTGWQKDAATGTWTLYDAVGTQLTGWQLVGSSWYYMDPTTGIMKTGWVQSPASGKWYYMNESGAMTTGWQCVSGTWYYMDSTGNMQTGWIFDGANWYFMNENGAMLSNTTVDGYVLGANGAWIK